MKILRQTILLFGLLTAILMFTGCEQLNNYVIREIQNSTEYQDLQQAQSRSLLDCTEDSINPGAVRVTIATNAFLKCTYYTDSAKTPLLESEIFLSSGEKLYVDDVIEVNSNSNMYSFSGFRIWEYDQFGSRKVFAEFPSKQGILLTIPEEYTGAGFSVEPFGHYESRRITAKAFYIDNGQEVDLPGGSWTINGERFYNEATISPSEAYTVVYEYSDYSSFYFVKSTPANRLLNEEDQKVTFPEISATEESGEFSVELHRYIPLTISFQKNSSIIFIKAGSRTINPNDLGKRSFTLSDLKVGDTIVIRVGPNYKINGLEKATYVGDGWEYTIDISETTRSINIDVSERNSDGTATYQGYNHPNADITITRANGTTLQIGDELPGDDEKVILTIKPHDGYYIAGSTAKNNYCYISKSMKYSKLQSDISSILEKNPAKPFIQLRFVFSDNAGTYTYTLDGQAITSTPQEKVQAGQKLKVVFKANDGYTITHSWFGANAFSAAWTWAGGTDSISGSITVTEDMTGKVINREFFGLVVEKRR